MDTNISMLGAVIVAIISTIIGPTVVEYVKQKFRKKRGDTIKKDLEKNLIVDQELRHISEELDADRVWITQFHNGGHFLLSNKSIQKFSITYEITKVGVAPASQVFKDIPISLYSRAMNQILENGHIYVSNFEDTTIDSYCLKSAAFATGTKSSYIVALYDIATDRCIGTVGVDYIKKRELHHEQIDVLSERANRIAGYFGFSETTFHEIKKRQPEVSEAYNRGVAKACSFVGSMLMGFIREKENTQSKLNAIIFYLKTQGGWGAEAKNDNKPKLKFPESKSPSDIIDTALTSLEQRAITLTEAQNLANLAMTKLNISKLNDNSEEVVKERESMEELMDKAYTIRKVLEHQEKMNKGN